MIEGVIKENDYDSAAPDTRAIMIGRMADVAEEEWQKLYDEGDPSMAGAGGLPAWELQCAKAAEEFSSRVGELLEEIEVKLSEGEYFR